MPAGVVTAAKATSKQIGTGVGNCSGELRALADFAIVVVIFFVFDCVLDFICV